MGAVKKCVDSNAFGIGGGDVFGNYGGLSFSHVDTAGVASEFTPKEIREMSPAQREDVMDGMSHSNQETLSCLMDEWDRLEAVHAQQLALTNAQGLHQTAIVTIQGETAKSVARINAAKEIAVIGQGHECNAPGYYQGHTDTLARNVVGNDDEHGECMKNTDRAMDYLFGPSN